MTWGDFKKIVESKLSLQGYLPEAIESAEVEYIDMHGDDVMGEFDVYVEEKPYNGVKIRIH